jgi:hypothetical protein
MIRRNSLGRRIEWLEAKFGVKQEARAIIVTINPNNFSEDDFRIDLRCGGLWAYAARGGPFTEEEIRGLRAEYEGYHWRT